MSDNLLSGLEKLGLDVSGMDNLFGEEKKEEATGNNGPVVPTGPKEEELLLNKGIRCPMCDKTFYTRNIKSARAKRLEPDPDLRPHFEGIDPTKYDVDSCPFCGYTAISKFFPGENLTSIARKGIQENVCSKLTKHLDSVPEPPATYTYDEAIERYKLALFNTIAKNGKNYEKAYTCLKISWLLRGKAEELEAAETKDEEAIATTRKEEATFYKQAYDGLNKALSTEDTTKLMDSTTLEYLMAQMAFKLSQECDPADEQRMVYLSAASRAVSRIVTSQVAPNKIKDKARDLKDQIVAVIKAPAK